MQKFSDLLNQLYYTYSNLGKVALLKEYFASASDPDRGYALAVIAGTLDFKFFKRGLIRDLISERTDPVLFDLAYDYVGDLSETAALIWEPAAQTEMAPLPGLEELIQQLNSKTKLELKIYLRELLDRSNAVERWALLKLGTGSLRIGVSTRFLKQALAQYGNKDIHEIEQIWHGLQPPYQELFAWLENKNSKPDIRHSIFFHPVMLAQPLDAEDLEKLDPQLFISERK
jgi:DNA ligase-1